VERDVPQVSRSPAATLGLAVRELGRIARELGRVPRERSEARPYPPESGLVADLGAGQSAFPRADVVIDRYVADDFERGFPLSRAKPLIVADGHALPFRDGALSYLIASHVLEHATDPERFAGEISRVAGAGFVQVPSALSERVFGWPFHPWLIERDGDGLVFSPKPADQPSVGEPMHDLYHQSALFRIFWLSHRSVFHHSLHWRDRVRVRVIAPSAAERTAELDVERTISELRRVPMPALSAELRDALACPACRGELRGDADMLECRGCGRAYPMVESVPLLLEEAVGLSAR
jgi:uncharacterized protein YbaR (Trm112 family)